VDIFDFEAEGLDRKGIQTEVRKVIETQDVERLRIALRVLRAILR